jgi:hypothetical protein
MLKVALAGIGVWSEQFSGWEQFCAFVRGDSIDVVPRLQPELIQAIKSFEQGFECFTPIFVVFRIGSCEL